MVVGISRFELYMSGNRSLKDKRRLIRSLVDGARAKFPRVSMAEVGSLDMTAMATMGVGYVSNDASLVNSVLEKLFLYIDGTGNFRLGGKETEILHF